MEPSSFDQSNAVMGPPPGMSEDECRSLCVCKAQVGRAPVVLSCWKPTQEELEQILKTGRVWLWVFGHTMPPVYVGGEDPWKQEG